MKIEVYGTLTIGDTTVIKVRVLDEAGCHVDSAWGQYHEIVGWLAGKGYPTLA